LHQRPNRVDLHIHSTASDGTLTPSEVVHLALERGLRVIALTDHDTVSGVVEAQAAAAGSGLEVIAGVEINAAGDGTSLHMLGFYVDPQNPPLTEKLRTMRGWGGPAR
jgi:predicted metal-dependent phosphoesterase TrpH